MAMDSLEKKVNVFMGMGEDHSGNSAELKYGSDLDDDDDDSENNGHHHSHQYQRPADRTLFWESQEALLQETLERHNLMGLKLRGEIKEMMEVVKGSQLCGCSSIKPNTASACSHCLRKSMAAMLSHAGYNATLRISKWEHTKKIPGGSHEYIEVTMGVRKPSTRTKKATQLVVEMELREEFKMGRGSEEYKKLVGMLPELFVGKAEYLTGIVRVMCNAAKRSMKEKKMHMGPWRTSRFMQMKWSASATSLSTSLPTSTSTLLGFHHKDWSLDDKSLEITAAATGAALSSFPLRQQIQPNCLAISDAPFVLVS